MFSDDYNYDLDDVLPDSAWSDDDDDEMWNDEEDEDGDEDLDDTFGDEDLLSLMDDDADELDIPYSDDE